MVRSLFEPFFSTCYYTSCEAVSLACLVEAEIVSPYHGILINTGVGNPTALSTRRLGNKRVSRASGEAHGFYCLYKEIRIPLFHPRLLLPLLIHSPSLELQHPSSHLLRKAIPSMSEAGGKWMASSVRTSRSFGRPDTCPQTSCIGFQPKGRSSHPETLGEGSVPLSLRLRTGIPPPSIRPRTYVLLRAGLP